MRRSKYRGSGDTGGYANGKTNHICHGCSKKYGMLSLIQHHLSHSSLSSFSFLDASGSRALRRPQSGANSELLHLVESESIVIVERMQK